MGTVFQFPDTLSQYIILTNSKLSPAPLGWTEERDRPIRGQELCSSHSHRVGSRIRRGHSPPRGEGTTGKAETQSEQDQADCVSNVQSTSHDVGVTGPPGLVLSHDPDVEKAANKEPVGQVPECSRGDHATNAEDSREVDEALVDVSLCDLRCLGF